MNVTVGTQSTGVPAPWTAGDVGSPALTGSTTVANGVFTVTGAGWDISGTSDEFHFVHQPVAGDVEIVARLLTLDQSHAWAKAGVMIRESLAGPVPHAFMTGTAAQGWAFQHRPTAGAMSPHAPGTLSNPPGWIRLVRTGNSFSGYQSTDGSTWQLVSTVTIPMPQSVYVGLAVTSHNTATRTTATFSNVTVRPLTGTNTPPTVSITSPSNGTTYTAPATMTINANAADSNGTVTRVDFYRSGTLLGSDTSSPYSYTWSNAAAGTYALTAVATDNGGAATTSAAVNVTVGTASNQPPTVSMTTPANGATFMTTGKITLTATALRPDGTVSRVAFYSDNQKIGGDDTSSPYAITWTPAAQGTYTLTAVATTTAERPRRRPR